MMSQLGRPSCRLVALLLGACADEDLPACGYDADVTVSDGPDAGLSVSGALSLLQVSEETFRGVLMPYRASRTSDGVVVRGTLSGDTVEMTLSLPDGGIIAGSWIRNELFPQCPPSMEGPVSGPQEGDVGAWSGVELESGADDALLCRFTGYCAGEWSGDK